MAVCSMCGNDYDKAFEVRMPGGAGGTFDSFECAISALAPRCEHCGCAVIGHGVEADGAIFCCASCARAMNVGGVRDRAEQVPAEEQLRGIGPTRPPAES
ncbi:MAG TPA: hypothetical protein VNO79_01285 [Actinomycetota bacterium]|nr:hypothetical protein [Actinomycetota bacterium]